MRGSFCLFVFLIAFLPRLKGEEHWIRLTTPHFDFYSTGSEKRSRDALLFFEQVRSFFLETSVSKNAPQFPVRIIAFDSEQQFAAYRPRSVAFAYYTAGRMRDYIVMQDAAGEHYPAALHEYTHLILRHTGLKFPLWLNEGWAEVYSSLKPMGNHVMVGAIIPGRMQSLVSGHWIPLRELTRVDHESSYYNEKARVGIFYAQSWALAHMLMLWPEYRPKFGQFALAIGSGQSFEEVCQSVYGKTVAQVEKDLHNYFSQQRLFGAVFDVKLEKSAEQPQRQDVSPFESKLVLADLLATVNKTDEAKTAYLDLQKTDPSWPEVYESLGYLAWQKGDKQQAVEYFSKASEAGSRDPQMYLHYAVLRHYAGAKGTEVLPILRRALELKPDYAEARMELATSLLEAHDYAGALDALREIKSVTGEMAPAYFSARAYASLQTGKPEDAQKYAEASKKYAHTPQQREQADSLLRYLKADEQGAVKMRDVDEWARRHPPVLQHSGLLATEETQPAEINLQHAEGLAVRLECNSNDKRARLVLTVEGQETIFDIEDPETIVLRHNGDHKHQFLCGAQDSLPMKVQFSVVDGKNMVKTLEF